jgi:hypothetical protein
MDSHACSCPRQRARPRSRFLRTSGSTAHIKWIRGHITGSLIAINKAQSVMVFDVGPFLREQLAHLPHEMFAILLLDTATD